MKNTIKKGCNMIRFLFAYRKHDSRDEIKTVEPGPTRVLEFD